MLDITGVILAGGVGSRFLPFSTDKTLFPFMGESLLYRTISMLSRNGIRKVVVATNGANHAWLSPLLSTDFADMDIQLCRQSKPQGMGDALLAVRDLLPQRHILVMNAGDMVSDHLLTELLPKVSGEYAMVTGLITHTYQPLGYFELDGNNVIGIKEKPGATNMPSNVANLVFHYFSDPGTFLDLIEEAQQNSDADDIYEQALTQLMHEQNVGLYRYDGPWQKLKFGHHVLDMTEFFLREVPNHIDVTAHVARTAVIHGPVQIAARARIMDHAVIQGPAYIGEDAIIGNHALVRSSIVEHNSVVGYGSEIVRSYLGPECDLHHVYIGDSVLENGVHFGFNAHVTNLRFDRQPVSVKLPTHKQETDKTKLGALVAKGAEVGANATLMPGVTLGANSLVNAGAVVYDPVPDDHVLKYRQSQEIAKREAL
jgi:NDP-sugar pyrophosphorylase family protein